MLGAKAYWDFRIVHDRPQTEAMLTLAALRDALRVDVREAGMIPLLLDRANKERTAKRPPYWDHVAKMLRCSPDLSVGEMIQRLYSADFADPIAIYHNATLNREHWESTIVDHVAAGSIQSATLNGMCCVSNTGTDFAIGISVGLYQILLSFARTLVSTTDVSSGTIVPHPRRDEAASAEMLDLIESYLEVGMPFGGPSKSELMEAQETLAQNLAIMGTRFVYFHELSHFLRNHHDVDRVAPFDRYGLFQELVHTHGQEFDADHSGLVMVLLGHRSNIENVAMAYAGSCLFMHLLNLTSSDAGAWAGHPHPLDRLERLRFWIDRVLDHDELGHFSVESVVKMERLWTMVIQRLRIKGEEQSLSGTRTTPFTLVVNECAENNGDCPSQSQVEHFLWRTQEWLAFGAPERVCLRLGEAKGQAILHQRQSTDNQDDARFFSNVEMLIDAAANQLRQLEFKRHADLIDDTWKRVVESPPNWI